MEKKIRVGAVSYLNTKPLIYGFEQGLMADRVELALDYPSNLSAALQKGRLDVALLPVAAIPQIPNARVISKFGIASARKVASVCLFSQVPFDEIQEIYLDYQSRSSVALLRILLRDYWHIRPMLQEADEHYIDRIGGKTAGIIIGDRALANLNRFEYVYDLAEAWHEHTQLPFVFAVWVSNIELSEEFTNAFDAAVGEGLQHLDEIIATNPFHAYNLGVYYRENMSYELDEDKQKGMKLFLKAIKSL